MPDAAQITYALRRQLNRLLWRPLRQMASVVHPLPLLAAVVVWIVLAHVGQLHEVYVATLEQPDRFARGVHVLLAIGALMIASATLFYVSHLLSAIRIDVIYAQSGDYANDRYLKTLRNLAGCALAFVPWLGVAYGLRLAAQELAGNIRSLAGLSGVLPALAPSAEPAIASMRGMPTALEQAGGIALIIGFVWVCMLYATRQQPKVRWTVIAIGALFLAFVLAVPHLYEYAVADWLGRRPVGLDIVTYARSVGPLATVLAVLVVLMVGLALLAYLSGQIGFPLIPVVLGTILLAVLMQWPLTYVFAGMLTVFGVLMVMGLLSRKWALGALSAGIILALGLQLTTWKHDVEGRAPAEHALPTLEEAFRQWLAARNGDIGKFRETSGRDYPVFIVAAQGGGIYAASAATAFLAALQDRCPSFARHVFAISAVSGGAVGATAFQTMLQPPAEEGACVAATANRLGTGALQARAARVMRDDHFSPVLGMMLMDLAGFDTDRAVALERSFARSVAESGGPGDLTQPFDRHWTPAGATPALLLNATWVETGYRVAYAPFTLNGMHDKTLYGFFDAEMAAAYRRGITLAQAAITSARFPGVLPARVEEIRTRGKEVQRWNFVDGGYADGSGAASALEVYKALEPIAGSAGIDLRVVLLTNARADQDFSDVKGIAARDLLAPALAVLRVRDLLSQQAVTRALSDIEKGPNSDGQERAKIGRTRSWKAAVVELDQKAFTLPLSWQISRATHTIVSLSVASIGICSGKEIASARGDASTRHVSEVPPSVIHANSCVAQSILKLLDPRLPLD